MNTDKNLPNLFYSNSNNNSRQINSFGNNLPNSVPYQPISLPNPLFQNQTVNVVYRNPHNFGESTQNAQENIGSFANYYGNNSWSTNNMDKVSHENQNSPTFQYQTPNVEKTKLQATAKEFVPRLQNCERVQNLQLDHKQPVSNNSNSNERHSQEPSTRPKQYTNKRWQKNKENKTWENYNDTQNYGRYPNRTHVRYADNNRYYNNNKNSGYSYYHSKNSNFKTYEESNVNYKNSRTSNFDENPNNQIRNSDRRRFNEGSYYENGWNRHQYNGYNNVRGNKRYSNYNTENRKQRDGIKKDSHNPKYTKNHSKSDNISKEKLSSDVSCIEESIETSSSYTNNINEKENNQTSEARNTVEESNLEKQYENISSGKIVTEYKNEKMQRESMIENLSKGIYECMVCCDRIKQAHAIWSCGKCYNCFHLGCVKKWAGTSSQGEPGWRCPACQNQNSKIPVGYFCFCKKLREPEWNRRETPHSCGEVCGKRRENEWCVHKCTILCHPGPCPDCTAFIRRQCQCGKDAKDVRCSHTEPFLCGSICGKSLNCSIHKCTKLCHVDSCEDCFVTIEKECFCGKEKRSEICTSESTASEGFSCGVVCGKKLSCNNHFCKEICHESECNPCGRALKNVTTCPCGKKSLEYLENEGSAKRMSCLDPIPTCDNICGKILKCGTPGNYHTCKEKCHEGDCPQCKGKTNVKCRCGSMNKNIQCSDLLTKADEVLCEKQCKKLRQCGRHKCGVKCCIDIDHICNRICGKNLKCRQHKCQEPCHRGNCPRCWETSFEELTCHCGASILYPPIPCGTEPPVCHLPCQRRQSCSHLASHSCHTSDPKCPPCTTLVGKSCFGNHMIMKSTPCYISAMSCGEQCAKKLPCGVHLCQRVCHDGLCIKGSCKQKCMEPRSSCEHTCGNPCHSGPCPNTPCKVMVTVTCVCSNRKTKMLCSENEKEYKSLATSRIASELHSLNSGGSVDISQIFSRNNKSEKFKRLDCNEDCKLIARNRQLSLALQIENPDAREFIKDGGSNLFTDSIKDEARKDIQFAQVIHSALNDLVLKAKESKQKNRSHSFAPMNRDKRRFIHEYSKYFGCQSQSYDEEPKKNVVVTACKYMCQLPPISIVAVIQKEQGQRKGPGPVINRKIVPGQANGSQLKKLEKSSSFEKKDSPPKEQDVIDYFDFS